MMSYHLRVFFITAVLVGTVLMALLLLGRSRLLAVEIARLDGRLCMEARRVAHFDSQRESLERLTDDLQGKLRLHSPQQLRLRTRSGDGAILAHDWPVELLPNKLRWFEAPSATLAHQPDNPELPHAESRCELAAFTHQGKSWRAARVSQVEGEGLVAVDLAATDNELQALLQSILRGLIPAALLLTALGSWLVASLAMRPVNRLREAMKTVTGHDLDRRLSCKGEDREFADLIQAYNTMLSRLESSFLQASRFSADAAHELKTPLTILQGLLEQALNSGKAVISPVELTSMLDEVMRLSAITRKLLLLSQADAGKLQIHRESIALSQLLIDLLVDARMLLQAQQLEWEITPALQLTGDAVLLRQLLNNLLSNAIHYALPAGWIRVTACQLNDCIHIDFANNCLPVSTSQRQHFFDRFYRGDASHGRLIDGSGLGLSLAREIARAHGGDLHLVSSAPDVVKLHVCLPCSPA